MPLLRHDRTLHIQLGLSDVLLQIHQLTQASSKENSEVHSSDDRTPSTVGSWNRQASKHANSQVLTVYADAAFAGKIDEMKSTSGFNIIDPYSANINSRFMKKRAVAKSMANAEFNATAIRAKEGSWLQNVQTELYPSVSSKAKEKKPYIQLFIDNHASIISLTKGKFCASTRHVGVRYFWLKEIIETGEAEIEYI